MTAQIIDMAAFRIAREQAAKARGKLAQRALIEAAILLNPFALMWLDALEYAARHATAPTVIMSEED